MNNFAGEQQCNRQRNLYSCKAIPPPPLKSKTWDLHKVKQQSTSINIVHILLPNVQRIDKMLTDLWRLLNKDRCIDRSTS